MPDLPGGGDVRPIPDPTVLTTEALLRAVAAERAFVDGQVAHLREVVDERFSSVQMQFGERDVRHARESDYRMAAMTAAFAAMQEASAQQDHSHARAIGKLEQLLASETKALADRIEDVKDRLGRLEIRATGAESVRAGGKEQLTSIYSFVAFLVTVLIIGTVLAANGVFSK